MSDTDSEIKKLQEEITELKDLISHAWVHDGYANLGYRKMTTEQRTFYDALIDRRFDNPDPADC